MILFLLYLKLVIKINIYLKNFKDYITISTRFKIYILFIKNQVLKICKRKNCFITSFLAKKQ